VSHASEKAWTDSHSRVRVAICQPCGESMCAGVEEAAVERLGDVGACQVGPGDAALGLARRRARAERRGVLARGGLDVAGLEQARRVDGQVAERQVVERGQGLAPQARRALGVARQALEERQRLLEVGPGIGDGDGRVQDRELARRMAHVAVDVLGLHEGQRAGVHVGHAEQGALGLRVAGAQSDADARTGPLRSALRVRDAASVSGSFAADGRQGAARGRVS